MKDSKEPAYHPVTVEDLYRQIYFEAVDHMISAIRERLSQPSFEAYENMESFLFKSITSQDASKEIAYLQDRYDRK